MKTLKKSAYLLLLCLAVVATSCKSDDDNNEEEEGGNGTELFTAKIDGANFAASTDFETLIGGSLTTSQNGMVLVAQGSTNDGDFINFSITEYNGVGTYTTGDDIMNPNGIQYGEVSGGATIWASNLATAALGTLRPGEINVTSQDETGAKGTFSFEGYNAQGMTTKNVTEGKFEVIFDN